MWPGSYSELAGSRPAAILPDVAPASSGVHVATPGYRMLQRICISLVASLLLAQTPRAATLVEEVLPAGWLATCSPCTFSGAPESFSASRVFASFDLGAAASLDGASFPVSNTSLGALGDFSVSIWSSPFAAEGPLLQTLIREGDYARFIGSKGFIDIALPNWQLSAGSYWLSVFGLNGDGFQWGGVAGEGDDRRYINGNPFLAQGSTAPQNYRQGFSLRGSEPVVTPIGGTLPLLLGGMGLLALLRRKANS